MRPRSITGPLILVGVYLLYTRLNSGHDHHRSDAEVRR